MHSAAIYRRRIAPSDRHLLQGIYDPRHALITRIRQDLRTLSSLFQCCYLSVSLIANFPLDMTPQFLDHSPHISQQSLHP